MDSLELRRTATSGDLLPARLAPILATWTEPRAKMKGQELRLARELDLDDPAAIGFVLDFMGQGVRIEVSTQGASSPLLVWAVQTLGAALKAEVEAPPADRAAALEYLEGYEEDVSTMREAKVDLDGDAFVDWLVREELVELGRGRADFSDLPLDDAERTYELILDNDVVEDVFVSERELARLLERFLARAGAIG